MRCEAEIAWRLDIVDGWPRNHAERCGQVVGTRPYLGADERYHAYCPITGHEEQVRRRYPEALAGSRSNTISA